MMKIESNCRSCGRSRLKELIHFGRTPLADRLVTAEGLREPEITAPLTLVLCTDCSLVQIRETVSPEILFDKNYPYFSSVSPALMKHFRESALDLIKFKNLNENSLVVELASNDGYMLRNFVEAGIPVLGIDPAEGPAQKAMESGIPTLNMFFTKDLAVKLRQEGRQADLVTANNVLAHVPDLNGFVEGIFTILKETGTAAIEAPYLGDLIEKYEFDTIYHQHLCYFSVTALSKLFRRHSLFLNDLRWVPIHGGSLRLFIEKKENVSETVKEYLDREKTKRISSAGFYEPFKEKIQELRAQLRNLLSELKLANHKIAGYGAAAKATTLLSYFGINKSYLDYIADLNSYKHGKYMGINHLPIYPSSRLPEDMPDYTVILAWNFADEIIRQQAEYLEKGGKFIIPIPEVKVIDKSVPGLS